MSSPLSAEEKSDYTRIIDGILATADLQTVSRKTIRAGLEDAVGRDLSSQKTAIKALIEARFDAINSESPPPSAEVKAEASPMPYTNGRSTSGDGDGDADSEIKVSLPTPKKRQKRESSSEDADARLAAELQAQENRRAGRPQTRGAGTAARPKAKPKKAKTAKKKSEKRVRSDDDSDVDANGEPNEKKRKAGGGFQKPFNLSNSLQMLLGEPQLSRPQVVKKLWEHIKANELQDPSDKRQIVCDDKMQAVFERSRVDMFQMNKLLGSHLYPIEE
ncbi:SWIB/MDM2 domain-containing protein [Schizothecium vesticola]|uniref:SWIB/MDM2 domain-containing protein n=1 Tax=Schizothecium vesticola TaxID=314040 RepID=A0AA40K8N4_9PEZI|nr:SWIB/MDM2 domain-containing protein [Schizothecium vesticola]